MSIQTKILALIAGMVAILGAGLLLLKHWESEKFRAIANRRLAERQRTFADFIRERGDGLKAVVEDSTAWDDLVRALQRKDADWAAQQFNEQSLPSFKVNAVWIYRPDGTLFYSCNNRYSQALRELPIDRENIAKLFGGERTRHFFVKTPQGWMEVQGATIHPSHDRFRETTPQGWFFAAQFWIDENIRRMSQFTGYSIRVVDLAGSAPPAPNAEEQGLISFFQTLPDWTGHPVARIEVQNDSPIIRELNDASRRLFWWLAICGGAASVLLSILLGVWVRRPLRLISRELEQDNPRGLEKLRAENNEFGELARLILSFRKTRETLLQTEEQLRHAQKLESVGRLAGGVAHDFNNLLTAIIGYSELLEANPSLNAEQREYACMVRKAGEQAAGLTRQLLAFSRKQLLQPKVVDLNLLLLEMEKLMQRVIGEHIRIVLELAAPEARGRADPDQLQQVILNLGINARDAMPRGGVLVIRTALVSNEKMQELGLPATGVGGVTLAVNDTGWGMDEATLERIFEPFFTTKGPGKGTGLGLATVYGIVAQSGGTVQVESTPGKGSTFIITLPRVEAPLDVTVDAPRPVAPGPRPETILVVEDEELVRELVCAVLRDAGYRLLCAATPSEALAEVESADTQIDLLVSDVVMPEMHGPELSRLLLARQPHMKVLYVSGYSEGDISDQGVLEPGLEVLQKPFTQQSLIKKIEEVLGVRSLRAPTGVFSA